MKKTALALTLILALLILTVAIFQLIDLAGQDFSISILEPQSAVYPTPDQDQAIAEIYLVYVTNELASWIGYSLDGNSNVTIYGNFTILPTLPVGEHALIVYANDTAGNTGISDIRTFWIANGIAPRSVTIISLRSAAHNPNLINVAISAFDGYTCPEQIFYSIDGQEPVCIAGYPERNGSHTLSGATTLSLSAGSHSIVAWERGFLTGSITNSSVVYFTVGSGTDYKFNPSAS